MQASVLNLNSSGYRGDKQGAMLPPKRAFTQHYLSGGGGGGASGSNLPTSVYSSRTVAGPPQGLHDLRGVPPPPPTHVEVRGQPVHDLRAAAHDGRGVPPQVHNFFIFLIQYQVIEVMIII